MENQPEGLLSLVFPLTACVSAWCPFWIRSPPLYPTELRALMSSIIMSGQKEVKIEIWTAPICSLGNGYSMVSLMVKD